MAMKVDSKLLLSLFWATRGKQNISSFDKIIENENKKTDYKHRLNQWLRRKRKNSICNIIKYLNKKKIIVSRNLSYTLNFKNEN